MKRTIAVLLLAVLLAAGMAAVSRDRALQGAYADEYEAAARRLRMERGEVEKELEQVRGQLRQVVIGEGAVSILFEELPEAVVEEAYPLMQACGFAGVLALTPDTLPGTEGNLTVKEYQLLLSRGWTACVLWDDVVDLERYTRRLSEALEEQGLELPDALYVMPGDYHSFKDEIIRDQGYHIVVHHGETEEIIAREDPEELFHVGAAQWNQSGIWDIMTQTAEKGGGVVFSVDFSTESGCFDEELFGKMCQELEKRSGQLYVTGLQGLRENLAMAQTNRYLTSRREYLEGELERYDREIAAVYRITREELEQASSNLQQ